MAVNERTELQSDYNHPYQTWTNEENQNQGQHKTGRSPVSHDVCIANGQNTEGN